MAQLTTEGSTNSLQDTFLEILERILTHGRIVFRFHHCPYTFEDCLQEMLGLAWLWHCRLVQQGKDPRQFASVIASFAARHVRNGDRLCGYESAKDILSDRARLKHHFQVHRIQSDTCLPGSNLTLHALVEHRLASSADRAAFRIDFSEWLCSLRERDANLASDLAVGDTTNEVAQKYQLSPGRVSQLRQELYHSWLRFHGECPSPS